MSDFNNTIPDIDELVKLEYNPQVLYDILVGLQEQIRDLSLKVEQLKNKGSST